MSMCAKGNFVCIGRASGTICQYTLPRMVPFMSYSATPRPQLLSLNCNISRLAVIDDNVLVHHF